MVVVYTVHSVPHALAEQTVVDEVLRYCNCLYYISALRGFEHMDLAALQDLVPDIALARSRALKVDLG